RKRMKHRLRPALSIDKGFRRSLWRIDCSLQDKQFARDQKQFLEREHQMLAVINQAECKRDVELTRLTGIEIVNRHAPIIDLQPEQLTHKHRLADEIAL